VIVPGFDDADISLFEARLTLREIIDANNHLFYPQTWMNGEAFLNRIAEPLPGLPEFQQWGFPYFFPKQDPQRVSTASLCLLYVQHPTWEGWNRFWWTDDQDSHKDRVYVGGKNRTGRIEIHRYLTTNRNFGLPVWR
jgi:hypothetical protein